MAILKKGDWVLVDGVAGKIIVEDYLKSQTGRWHLVMRKGFGINTVRPESALTPIDPAFNNLLTDVNKESVGG